MTTDDTIQVIHDVPVLVCGADGAVLGGEREATDLVGDALSHGAAWVAVPVERIGGDFFVLRTRVAGDVVQKFVNYRLGMAVIGDITGHVEGSTALRDFVRESNRGRHLWFLPDLDALRTRLAT